MSPKNYPDEEIKLFVVKKLAEINKVRERMILQERQTKREYVSGESYYLWGKPYRLQVIYEGNKYEITKQINKIVFKVPKNSTPKSKENAFNEWYRKELKRVLDIVSKDSQSKMNIYANEFRIKNMKTKWGTCNIEKKRIWINLQLVKKPIECLEYVVIHELVHLIEKNHTHRFHALVKEFYPGWKEAKKLLTELPLEFWENGD